MELGAEGSPRTVAERYDTSLGGSNFDDRLFTHFAAEIAKKYQGSEVKAGTVILPWSIHDMPGDGEEGRVKITF